MSTKRMDILATDLPVNSGPKRPYLLIAATLRGIA
jgi:hypothetical protein